MDPELRGCAIFRPKMGPFARTNFLRKPVNKPCSYYSCLSTFQKPKSDINILMELKNTKISLVERHFWP